MARGVLKTQLNHHKLVAAIDKSKSKPVTEKKESLEEKNVVQPEMKDKPSKQTIKDHKKSKKEKKVDPDAYESTSLSKKEQRKLKKAAKKQVTKEEQEEEQEQEQEQEQENFDHDDEDEDDEEEAIDFKKLAESDSESDLEDDDEDNDEDDEDEDDIEEDKEEVDQESDEEDVPLSDVELDDDADVVPYTKLTINNTAALRESLARIELPWSKHMFTEHQSIISDESTEASIKDIYDDTERELAFYKQGLDAVKQARVTLLKLKVPFSRPMDYFAEMVKSDEHMDKLKNKLLTEAANKKASEEAKKQRSLKKFGKQVQHATLQERAKQKKQTIEKINSLKKKRGSSALSNEDDFQIALEEATKENAKQDSNKRRKPNAKRLGKDAKYGFGGKKRLSRENDKNSSADVSGFNAKKMKGKQVRPGKSKRSRRH